MRSKTRYDRVDKYLIKAELRSPMHVGSADRNAEEILIHPVTRKPFIQASSITGALRSYYEGRKWDADELFGSSEKDNDNALIKVTDGIFDNDTVLELRPRVKIDPFSGTVSSASVKGSGKISGHKFDTEYIGVGSGYYFSVYVYQSGEGIEDIDKRMLDCFSAIQNGEILFGGQKSSGCGDIEIKNLFYKKFDLRSPEGRADWIRETELTEKDYKDIKSSLGGKNQGIYRITVKAKVEDSILVKGYKVSDFGKDAPDSINIQNAKKDYIVPGTSFKGAVRSRTEYIAKCLKLEPKTIDEIFGAASEKDGTVGCARFYDAVIGKTEDNDKNSISHRIHIDKFTGGVMNGSLFSEKTAAGVIQLKVDISERNNPERAVGVIAMALRDLANGLYNLGGGYHIGHGFLEVKDISIEKGDKAALIDFMGDKIEDKDGLLKDCLAAVGKGN